MTKAHEDAKLEDLMAAMDVVDTLRHDQTVVAWELDQAGRRERLLARLKEMYLAQGIEVPNHVLKEGIRALKEERFKYTPVAPSWKTKLAHIWVSRKRWSKPIGFLGVLGSVFSGYYYINDVLPERQIRSELPQQISATTNSIIAVAKSQDIVAQSMDRKRYADSLLEQQEYTGAQEVLTELELVQERLSQTYSMRVVSRQNESSGVWRIPPGETGGRNFYLIVEAIDSMNKVIELTVFNEENNTSEKVGQWGLRVSEETVYQVAADKQDDGVIQNNLVGKKNRGELEPQYSIATTGGTITQW
ncbi:DUF6384 family protein [bacterium]|nr:DUF6384 family protein [bacterium]